MSARTPAAHLGGGALRVVASEGLALPAALVLSVFVARRIGPGGYGLYALCAAIVAWVEWTVASVLSRAIVLETSRRPGDVGLQTSAVQANALLGLLAMAGLWAAAPAIALVAAEPAMVAPLRLLAVDVPFFTTAMAHRALLVGRGAFVARATLPATRWTVRVALVVVLVEAGWSLDGVMLGVIGASIAELAMARRAVAPPFLRWPRLHLPLMADALPFFALGLTLRLVDRIDLLLFKSLGGTTAEAGLYGAAQGLAMSLSVLSVAFPPLLLSTLSRLFEGDRADEARRLAVQSLRVVCWLAPLVGLAWGAGRPVASLLFGSRFGAAGPLLAPLAAVALAQVLMAVVIMVLSAAGRPNAFLGPSLAMLATAVATGAVAIPRFGAMGAALAAVVASALGVGLALRLLRTHAGIAVPVAGFLRTGAAAVAAGLASGASVALVPLGASLAAGVAASAVTLWLTGELRGLSVRRAVSALRVSPATAPSGGAA